MGDVYVGDARRSLMADSGFEKQTGNKTGSNIDEPESEVRQKMNKLLDHKTLEEGLADRGEPDQFSIFNSLHWKQALSACIKYQRLRMPFGNKGKKRSFAAGVNIRRNFLKPAIGWRYSKSG